MPSQTESFLLDIQLRVQGDKQLQTLVRNLETSGRVAPRAQKSLQTASKGMSSFGRATQNASFQLTDFIVQVQGGQAASRAFAQQAPQLLAGFGALGAALGVVAAVLPAVIAGFAGGAKSSKALDDQIKGLNEQLGTLAETVSRVDFSSWIKSFNELDAQARTLATSILNLKIEVAEIDFQTAVDSFSGFVDVVVPGTKLANIQLQSIADNLGLSVGALEQLIPLISEFREDPFGDPQNLERITELLEEAGVNALPLLERLNALKAAQESLQQGQQTRSQAEQAGPTGLIPTEGDAKKDEVPQQLEKTASAAATAAIELNDYNQMLIEAQQGQEAFNATLAQAPEEFTLGDQAIQSFQQSFDTMLNGVLMGTQSIGEGFKDMAKVILAQLARLAANQFFANLFGFAIGGATPTASAQGNVFNNGNVVPFARGGIVNSPTIFPMARGGVGLMGEAGSEAVVPLKRTASGDLGVQASPVNVTVNNNAPGVAVRTGQDSGGGLTIDIVMEAMASSIRRGGTDVASALEESYSIGRGRAVY